MGRFHIKNILLGIGMGLVLTALTGIIYSAGREPQMSKEEIMAKQGSMAWFQATR